MQDRLKPNWQCLPEGGFDESLKKTAPYLMELVGTLFLVFVYEISFSTPDLGESPALTIGYGATALIFWGAQISGAHFNPAITIAKYFVAPRHFHPLIAIAYITTQMVGGFLGAILAAGVLNQLYPGPTVGTTTGNSYSVGQAFGAEFVWTFVLVSVVLTANNLEDYSRNAFYALAHGGTILAGVTLNGQISGAAFNPAIASGTKCIWFFIERRHKNEVPFDSNFWIYWIAPIFAAVIAAFFYRATNSPDPTSQGATSQGATSQGVRARSNTGNTSVTERLINERQSD